MKNNNDLITILLTFVNITHISKETSNILCNFNLLIDF